MQGGREAGEKTPTYGCYRGIGFGSQRGRTPYVGGKSTMREGMGSGKGARLLENVTRWRSEELDEDWSLNLGGVGRFRGLILKYEVFGVAFRLSWRPCFAEDN